MKTVQTLAASKKGSDFKVSQVVIVQPPKRETLDISKYTGAVKSSDKGKRNSLYDIYDNILKDPVIGESVRKRVRKITNGGLFFSDENKEVDEMTDLIKTPVFRKLLFNIIMTRFFGKSIIELSFTDGFNISLINRKNYDTSKKLILKKIGDDDGIPYENDDFLLNIGEDDDLGLLMEVAPFAIFKRNGGADYAEFCELWGIPILAGLYDPEEEDAREEMEATMEKRGAGGSIVMSKNSEVKSIASESKGAVHKEYLDWIDEQMLISLIGQTMTTKDGSSRSQSETHEEVQNEISEDDKTYTLEILNYMFLPRLEKRGYPTGKGWFNYPKKDSLTMLQKIEIAEKVDDRTESGVDEDYWYELTGIPKSKTPKNKKKDDSSDDSDTDPEPDTKGKKKVKAEELSFLKRIKDFFDHAPL
jgi:hypothetical protein